MKTVRILLLAPVLAGCALVQITDSYGNVYGNYYDHGANYRYQLATCEGQMSAVPLLERKAAMRCCMWRNGVPVDDAESCRAQLG